MDKKVWLVIAVLAAALFAVFGIARLVRDGDAIAFAHLSTAIGLALFAVRGRGDGGQRLWYAPELVLLLALLQYGYHLIGV